MPLADDATSARAVTALLKQANMPIDGWTVYTAATDSNHLLGRQNQYVAKMSSHDTRVQAPLHAEALGVDDGGGVELFATAQDLQAGRTTWRPSPSSRSSPSTTDYPMGQFTLLRVSHFLTPDQAAVCKSALASLG